MKEPDLLTWFGHVTMDLCATIQAQGYWAEWKWSCPTKFVFELKTPYKVELGFIDFTSECGASLFTSQLQIFSILWIKVCCFCLYFFFVFSIYAFVPQSVLLCVYLRNWFSTCFCLWLRSDSYKNFDFLTVCASHFWLFYIVFLLPSWNPRVWGF